MQKLAQLIQKIPTAAFLQFAMAVVFLGFGTAKFANYEQEAVGDLVSTHPLLRIGVDVLGKSGFSILLGVVELTVAILLFLGIVLNSKRLGFIGGLLGVVTFLTTLTIFPFVQYYQLDLGRAFLSSLGFFLLKDLGLLAACFEIARNNSLGIDVHALR